MAGTWSSECLVLVEMLRWDAAQVRAPTVHPCPATSSTGSGSFNSLTSSRQSEPEQAIIELLNILRPLPPRTSLSLPAKTIELEVRLGETELNCQSKSISILGPDLICQNTSSASESLAGCWSSLWSQHFIFDPPAWCKFKSSLEFRCRIQSSYIHIRALFW